MFLNECVITSNRVARWILNIKEYDIEIRNVKGIWNHLADILSRNPAGLIDNIRSLTHSDQVLVQCSTICRQDHSHGVEGSCSLAKHRSEASCNYEGSGSTSYHYTAGVLAEGHRNIL
jgi:hypothetical protein